jgi:hypothetical protein
VPPLEDVYQTDLLRLPGQWAFALPRAGIILVSDAQLCDLTDPDCSVDLSTGPVKRVQSLREVCREARDRGARTLIVAFDHFWSQYRPGQGHEPRQLMPDTEEYIQHVAKISHTAQEFGLGLELSVVSPLELGAGYRKAAQERGADETGRWLHYREGIRDPESGRFTVQLWQQERWGNNKGAFELKRTGIRAFTYNESRIPGTHLHAVSPKSIAEVSGGISIDEDGVPVFESGDIRSRRVTVQGRGSAVSEGDRVLVVLAYETPEMDYFTEFSREFLHDLLDRYHRAGVRLNGLYSDEMHIQQDWNYGSHHEHGQFAMRYVSDGLARRYAAEYGDKFADLDPYMVYFCTGQHDFLPTLDAAAPAQHVFGESPEAVHQTYLFRSRYYRMLEGGVVDLMSGAKQYAEELAGHTLEARAHVTWAESPTIDQWDTGTLNRYAAKYEYTSDFLWSNTVHQAASACQDYFRWNDYLTGGGNDHAEGGYADRDYFGLALACSTGVMNDVPYAYAAHWGMPSEIAQRRQALVEAYGACATPSFAAVENSEHRECEVLMLYPIDLVAVDERFGSWMCQYGYANYITSEKLLAEGEITEDGIIVLRGRRYTTLCVLFEPLPAGDLLVLMRRFVRAGGRLIWSGPPPVLTAEGNNAVEPWSKLFGAIHQPSPNLGLPVPGREIVFAGTLGSAPMQTVLTDLPVDRVYPLEPASTAEVVATCGGYIVGTHRVSPRGGSATAFGFRPRDDQSASLGSESRTWSVVLAVLGAYPSTDTFPGHNDNTEHISRRSPYLCSRFPNGATAVAVHFRLYQEGWAGGFHRDEEADRRWLEEHPLASDRIDLRDYRVNGHQITYRGRRVVAFRLDDTQRLVAFAGYECTDIAVDGFVWEFCTETVSELAFAPINGDRLVAGGAKMQVRAVGAGVIRVPLDTASSGEIEVIAEGCTPGSRGESVSATIENDALVIEVDESISGCWLYVVPR